MLETGVSSIVFYDVRNGIGISIITNNVNPTARPLALYIYFLLMHQGLAAAEKIYAQQLIADTAIVSQIGVCNFQLIFHMAPDYCLDGTYSSNMQGKIRIKRDYIKLGNLEPVRYKRKYEYLIFTALDVNHSTIQGYIKPIIKHKQIIGLNTTISCIYSLYKKVNTIIK